MNDWAVEQWRGTAADFHDFVPPSRRAVWVVDLTEPALVLGSTQSVDTIDPAAASRLGISVAKRHSGGGAVWLHPEESVWIDVTIPRDDPEWVDDVPPSMQWLGKAFVDTLEGSVDAAVHRAPYDPTLFARTVCFGGLAPGEVVAGGAKLIGISQRRTRDGARFQCVAYSTWSTEPWAELIVDPDVRDATRELVIAEIPVSSERFVELLVQSLPR